ncbi:MAG TPA: phage head closure protein [Gallionella sp.]
MRAGKLDRRITIKYKEVTQDLTYGTDIVTWQPLVSLPGSPRVAVPLWANVVEEQPSRSEAIKQGLALARNRAKITIRYRSDVDSSMRITVHMGGTDVVYQIIGGPAMIGRKEWLEMVCERYSS